ncbi:ABC transporter permease protein [Methanocella paludicola SANAE]|uniref:ABC transporter permease protein n=1 Tax=Methanocella paludicola (strain DSM 17711 / JCM 13418 / NBRC 101707 / SANAE) TaxID=304371 RepID=D1YZR8_METPS|nr:ABC transporter permease [Methanocella paludicola]BAI61940.1 ABC transporter permease protein [Methanocella paludicola SANAE]
MLSLNMFMEQLKRSVAIARKDMKIYYMKGPVITFGLIFPFFLIVAYTLGRNVPIKDLYPGIMGMTVFFTATSVGPAIIPWEVRSQTFERLISMPVALWAMLFGDVQASFCFGLVISLLTALIAPIIGVSILHLLVFSFALLLGTLCFATLSILLSAYPPTDTPGNTMMLASMIKFPLVFISGVFLPIGQMPEWGRLVSYFSPLTYYTDLVRYSIDGVSYFPILVDFTAIAVFTVVFMFAAIKIHEKVLTRRLT